MLCIIVFFTFFHYNKRYKTILLIFKHLNFEQQFSHWPRSLDHVTPSSSFQRGGASVGKQRQNVEVFRRWKLINKQVKNNCQSSIVIEKESRLVV